MTESTRASRGRRWAALRLAVLSAVILFVLRATGCMERFFYMPTRGPTPVPAELRGAELVTFDSADGTRLSGWFIPGRPLETGSGPHPTILHVHGNAGNITSHQWFTEALPPAGFNVFIFDYRGYGESAGRPRRRADLIADTHAALNAMLRRRDVDPLGVGLYGQSLGGSIALNVMADRSEIKAAVIESAFSSWREIAASALGGDPPGPIVRAVTSLLINDTCRPLDAIARIDRPILILHGSADTTVPLRHGQLLTEAGPQARLVVLRGGQHNTMRTTHPEVDALMIDFFRRYMQTAR